MFTIWDDLADNQGAALLRQLHEHHDIIAKWIDVTEYCKTISCYSNLLTGTVVQFMGYNTIK